MFYIEKVVRSETLFFKKVFVCKILSDSSLELRQLSWNEELIIHSLVTATATVDILYSRHFFVMDAFLKNG